MIPFTGWPFDAHGLGFRTLVKSLKSLAGSPSVASSVASSPVKASPRGGGLSRQQTVGDVFRGYDSGSGMMDAASVNAALVDLGVPISSPAAAQAIAAALNSAPAGMSKEGFRTLVKSLKKISEAPPATTPQLTKSPTIGDMFRQFDTSGSGTMEVRNLPAALSGLAMPISPRAKQHIDEVMARGTPLNKEEFRKVCKIVKTAPTTPESPQPTTIGQCFRQLDPKGTGSVSVDSLPAALSALAIRIDTPQVQRELASLVAQRMTSLSIEEFRAFVKKVRA